MIMSLCSVVVNEKIRKISSSQVLSLFPELLRAAIDQLRQPVSTFGTDGSRSFKFTWASQDDNSVRANYRKGRSTSPVHCAVDGKGRA